MDDPLHRLREFFSFNHNSGEQVEHQQLLSLLESLAPLPPFQVIGILHAQYLPVATCQRNLHTRFKLLENSRAEAIRCLPELEHSVSDAVLPLPAEASAQALTADNFLKSLAGAYTGIVSDITANHQEAALSHLLQQSIRRALRALLRRQILAYRAYALPSTSSWQQMHNLYRIARNQNLAGQGERSIERIYLTALLLAYADPNKIPRQHLDDVKTIIEGLAPLAGIIDASQFERGQASHAGRFLVKLDDGNPGRPLAKMTEVTPMPGNLIIECRAVISAIDRKLIQAAHLEDDTASALENLLTSLRNALGSQVQRRFSRIRFKPKVDLVAGFDDALRFIAKGTLARRQDDPGADPPPLTSEWSLINESPDGFGIRYRKGEKWSIQAGDLVVLRPREESRIHVCLVRRIANLDQNKLELGLQELASEARIIRIADTPAILLPHLPAFEGHAGLIVKADFEWPVGLEIGMALVGRDTRWCPGHHAECNGRVQFLVLEPL